MLATGADDFSDIIVPLLSGQDQQTRLHTYRLWPDIQVSSLGPNWREQVRGWSEEARADFVSELLHHRIDGEIAAFAAEDNSVTVKKAAVSGLMWTGSDDALTRVLESMDARTFEDVARKNADQMPATLRPKTIAAMRKFIESTTDHRARLRTALDLIELGEPGLDGVVKDAMAALSGGDMRNLRFALHPAGARVSAQDSILPGQASGWLTQVAEGVLYEDEYWLPFATVIPDGLVEKYLQRLETEDFKNSAHWRHDCGHRRRRGCQACRPSVCEAARAATQSGCGTWRATRIRVAGDAASWRPCSVSLPDDVAAAGVLSSVTSGDASRHQSCGRSS